MSWELIELKTNNLRSQFATASNLIYHYAISSLRSQSVTLNRFSVAESLKALI